MQTYVRSFGENAQLSEYISSHFHLPLSMHDRFQRFRKILASNMKQFNDLTELSGQIAHFFDLFKENMIVPSNWLIYASCIGYLHLKTGGRFVENTQSVFTNQQTLAEFCGMRARYTMLGLKDLISVRTLKCSTDIAKCITDLAHVLDSSSTSPMLSTANLFKGNETEDSAELAFVCALTAFDVVSWKQAKSFGVWSIVNRPFSVAFIFI